MQKSIRQVLAVQVIGMGVAAALLVTPSLAQSRPRKEQEDAGVRKAIAFERAKERADAAQARKQARHPEKFTYAQPQQNPPHSLATEQKRDALDHSEGDADRQAPTGKQ